MKKYIILSTIINLLFMSCTKEKDTKMIELDNNKIEKIDNKVFSTQNKTNNTTPQVNAENKNLNLDENKINDNMMSKVSGSIVTSRSGSASFKVAGHINKINYRGGEIVKKGQILAELDEADFVLREKLALASIEQTKIQLEQAKKDLNRETELKKENVSTEIIIERVINTLASLQAGMNLGELNIQQVKKARKDTKLIAPYDAQIIKRLKVEGEFVGVGQPVFDLVEIGTIEILLKIPETLIKKISIAKQFNVYVPATDINSIAKVDRIIPIVNETSRTFDVYLSFIKNEKNILPGQFVEADIK